MEVDSNSTLNEWTLVRPKKTKREDQIEDLLMANKSKVFKKDAFSINTSNKFEALADEENINTNSNPNIIKSPPIYVHDVGNIKPMIYQLNLLNPEGYTLKILGNNQVKIIPKTSEIYSFVNRIEILHRDDKLKGRNVKRD